MRQFILSVLFLTLFANDYSHAQQDTLTVGTRVAAPFVMQDGESYTGITMELLSEISRELDIEFRYEERNIQGLLEGVEDGSLDMAASALTITSEREEMVDFTHPFFVTGLGLAVPYKTTSPLMATLRGLLSLEFLSVVFLLTLLLGILGVFIWLAERRKNPEEFGGSPTEGIGSGFWWSAVTMTTVGYGDKSPRTFAGRTIGFIWMFAGIILISFFTATIASSLTVSQLESTIQGPADLPNVRVGTLSGSATISYMEENRIRYTSFSTLEAGMQAVKDGQIDTFVHDAPILQHLAGTQFPNEVRVLPNTFNQQYFGIALPKNSELRDPINRVILDIISSEEWKDIQHRYLGTD